MARGVPHDDQTRAAVMSALLAGQSINEIARQYRLSNATVIAWRDAAGVKSTPVEPQKREEIGGLVADVLRELLTTVQVQARAYRNEAWLGKQDADKAAVLTGVLMDKAIRILEAIDPAEPDDALDTAAGAAD